MQSLNGVSRRFGNFYITSAKGIHLQLSLGGSS
jgi:hypothetical protein